MDEDILMIDMPQYTVTYSDDVYSYSSKEGKENLKKVLYKASNNYCMYCYNRIKIDQNMYGHLEHAIEKSISDNKLTDCVPNIGLACPICNDKYKKIGVKNRMPNQTDIDRFNSLSKCGHNFCPKPCKAYIQLKRAYLKKDTARFIMQPLGVTSIDIGLDEKRELKLQYDVLNNKFVPSQKENYSEKEKDFIKHHIDMFSLNSVERKSTQMVAFLKDTIQRDGKYTKIEYNNQVVELFVDKVLRGKSSEEILMICEKLYIYAKLKFNT